MTVCNGNQRFISRYTLIDFAIDFLKKVFFDLLTRALCMVMRLLFPKVFKTYRFVAYMIDGKVVAICPKMKINIK